MFWILNYFLRYYEPQLLNPGPHTLIIEFTTNDGSYHVDAYYEIEVKLLVPS